MGRKKKVSWDMDNLSEDFSENTSETNWWEHPSVIYAFNLPRVSAQMERLMGSNIVRLTDRKYMIDLRRRIYEDFDDNLAKRIEKREYDESEREKHLILKGLYNPGNCPDRLVCVHSIALASEMEQKTDLIMNGICPSEYSKHPVFVNNKQTNKIIMNRRAKLKTGRERLAEKLLKRGAKWERERLIVEETDKQCEEEIKTKRITMLNGETEYYHSNRERGLDLLRIHTKEYTESEVDLKNYLETKRAKKISKKKHDHGSRERQNILTKPIDVYSPTSSSGFGHFSRTSPITLDSPTSPFSPTTASPASTTSKSKKSTPIDSSTKEQLSPSSKPSSPKKSPTNKSDSDRSQDDEQAIIDGYMLSKPDFDKMYYEDPQVAQLKKINKVKDMYELADQIINGQYKLEKKLKKKDGNEEEEVVDQNEEEEDN